MKVQDMNTEKKQNETYVLSVARTSGVPIPLGESPGEEPDFRFTDTIPALGIELSEVLRPASSNYGILPVEEESFHTRIITSAQLEYYRVRGATPAHVRVFFTSARGRRCSAPKLTRSLVAFVRGNVHRANPWVCFERPETPEGFDFIVITTESEDWWSGECGGYTFDDIRPQLSDRILEKDKRVPTYRANLPEGSRVWLLLHSGVTVPRSMRIPLGIGEWKFPFQFDRVFWFADLERQFVEIQREECPEFPVP